MRRIRTSRGWVVPVWLLASVFHPVHAAGQDGAAEPGSGTFRDPRDGEEYCWVRIGEQEWMELEMALGLTRTQAEDQGRDRGGSGNTIGATLKKVGEWATEYQGRPIPVTNESGFSAIPAGLFAQDQFFHEGYTGWWSASAEGDQAWVHGLRFFDSKMGRDLNAKEFGYSVRCVSDTPGG